MKKIKLGDVLKVRRGASLSGDYYSEQGNLIRLTLGNFNYPRGGFQDNTAKKNIYFVGSVNPAFILKAGDIITPLTEQVSGLLGETATIPESGKYVQSGDIGLIIPDETKIDKRFAYYLVSSPAVRKQLDAAAQQTKIRHTSPDTIKACEAWIPEDVSTQRRIGKLLDALNNKITLNKKINATLEAMAKTLYDYWFVQFDFPDEHGKPYKTSGGKMIYSSELGRDIPAGWKVDTLEGKIAITRGISYSTGNLSTNEEGIAMINLASVDRKRHYIPSGLKFFIGNVPNEKKVQAMDMLIACTDLTRQAEIIGSPILVMNDREYTFSMDLAKLTVTDEKLSELYLYMTLRTNFYHQYIVGFASGTTVLHLNTSGIEWYKVLIPPMALQEKFAVVMKNIYFQTCKNICENQRLIALHDWLLPMLMNRQVVPNEM